MQMLSKLSRFVDRILIWLSWLTVGIIFIIILLTCANTFGRAVLNSPIAGAYEITEGLLVTAVFLGFGRAQATGKHVRIEIIRSMFPVKTRAICDFIGLILTAAIFCLFTSQATESAYIALTTGEYAEGLFDVPVWPARWSAVVGIFFFTVRLILDACSQWQRLHNLREKE